MIDKLVYNDGTRLMKKRGTPVPYGIPRSMSACPAEVGLREDPSGSI
jgi:hypothetical protein